MSSPTRSRNRSAVPDVPVLRSLPRPMAIIIGALRRNELLLHAAGLAFYALISFVPFIIVILWFAGLVLGDQRIKEAADQLKEVAPQNLGADKALQQVSQLGTSLGFWAILVSLWPASAYGSGLKRAFDFLAGGDEDLKGLRGRLLALCGLLPAFAIGGLVSSYFGTTLVADGGFSTFVGWVLALGTGFLGSAASIVLIYRLFPEEPLNGRRLWIATAAAAAGVSVLSLALTIYLASGADFKQHYATSGMAGIVLVGLWLYLANAMLLAGYVTARDLDR